MRYLWLALAVALGALLCAGTFICTYYFLYDGELPDAFVSRLGAVVGGALGAFAYFEICGVLKEDEQRILRASERVRNSTKPSTWE
jgi:hypothetical protein